MRYALLHGATPAAAATYALTAPLPHPDAAPPTPIPDTAQTTLQRGRGGGSVAARKTPTGTDHLRPACPRVAGPWPGPSRDSARRRSSPRPAQRVDHRCGRADHLGRRGATGTGAIAQRWADTGTGIEIEHLLSDCVTGVFSALAASTPTRPSPPATARPVLLAGMAGDQHRLPIVVLSATLAQRGVACRSLGTDLPAATLAAAIRRTAPAAVLLWSQLPDTADPGPAEVPAPYPTRVPHLHRGPRLGRRHTRTKDRAVELTSRGDRRHQHVDVGASAAPPEPVAGSEAERA